jgi:CubicO group peptidase (beta-lactamase class C family)
MQGKIFRISAIIFTIAILISGCTTAPKKPDPIIAGNYDYVKEHITWLANKEMKKKNVVGLSIAIVDDQRIVWSEGFGYADKKHNKPATPETLYRIASISKLFTVMAVMQLAEHGKIDIDQPFKSYLPAFSVKTRFKNADPITLRSMMTHHSSLPSGVSKGMWADEPPEKLLYRLKGTYVAFPPNYVLAYSNAAMGLLGLMIEAISDTEFCTHMDKSIIKPIGMAHSSYKMKPELEGLLSKGYRNGKEAEQVPLRDLAAGSMYSNVIDLSRFMRMVFANGRINNQQILNPDTIEEMLRPQNKDVVMDFGNLIGLGWFINYTPRENLKVAEHGGGTPLFRTHLMIMPEKKLGVVVLTNSTEGSKIHTKIGKEALKLALEAKTGLLIEDKDIGIQPPDQTASEELLMSFVGRYATLSMLGSITRNDEILDAKFDRYDFRLIPSSDGAFGVERRLLGLFPLKKIGNLELANLQVRRTDFAGREVLAVHYKNQHWFSADKINPLPLPKSWENALGKYKVQNPDKQGSPKDIRLAKREGLLEISYELPLWYPGRGKVYLSPISETEAVTTGIGRYSGETVHFIDIDGEQGLFFWGYKMKKEPTP